VLAMNQYWRIDMGVGGLHVIHIATFVHDRLRFNCSVIRSIIRLKRFPIANVIPVFLYLDLRSSGVLGVRRGGFAPPHEAYPTA